MQPEHAWCIAETGRDHPDQTRQHDAVADSGDWDLHVRPRLRHVALAVAGVAIGLVVADGATVATAAGGLAAGGYLARRGARTAK